MRLSEFIQALIMWANQYVCSGAANAAQYAECMGGF